MTTAPHWLVEPYAPVAPVEKPRTLDKYVIEALGTFGLVLTVGFGLCSGTPFAALGIGAVLMALIYAGGHRAGAHFNPAITLAAAMWGRIPFRDAAVYWLTQLAASLCAAIAWRLIVGSGQSQAVPELMLGGRALVAAFGAELLFTFVLGYVVFSCIESRRDAPNTLWHFAICVAVVAGTVDFAALFGGVFLVSQVIVGAFTGIAFSHLRIGGPMMRVEVHILGATFVIAARSHSWRQDGVDAGYGYRSGSVPAMDQRVVGGQTRRGRTGLRRFRRALAES